MNYLAHIYLARYSEDAMIGALLGDFVKPHSGFQFSAETEREILIHRKVDAFTDSHPRVVHAKSLFAGPRRRYAGIVLDVFYDHLLAVNWASYCALPLDQFIAQFYHALRQQAALLPPRLAHALPVMIEQDWLGSYRAFAGVDIAIRRIATRLSKNGDVMVDGLADLKGNYAALADGFEQFFPELIAFVDDTRATAAVAT